MELTEEQIVALVFASLQYFKGTKKITTDQDFDSFYQMYHYAKFRFKVQKKESDRLAGKAR